MKLVRLSITCLTTALLSISANASSVDSASFEFATGNMGQLARVGLQWNWDQQWWKSNGTHISGYWDLNLAHWKANNFQGRGVSQSINDIGMTPVFRFENDSKKGVYFEAGVGTHMLSDIYDNNHRTFSSKFQFGDHIGVGYVFDNGLDLAFKVQHFSNAGVSHPNPGVNYAVVKAGYAF